jgi:hypothetical protein
VHVDVHAARHRVLARLRRVVRHDDQLALTLDDAAVLDDAVDLRGSACAPLREYRHLVATNGRLNQ